MTAIVLVVGQPDWDHPDILNDALQGAYLRLRPDAGQVVWATLGQTGPEAATETWVLSHGMQLHPVRALTNKYARLNHVLRTVVPDLVLTFGQSNVVAETAKRCRLYGIRHAAIE